MLDPALEDAWSDFRRSLARKGRSEETVGIYRASFEGFWRWAESVSLPPDPGKIIYRDVNRWVDAMLAQPAVKGGKVQYETDPDTGEQRPTMISANTIRIRWQNLRPFFSWWASEMDETNPFTRADPPRLEQTAVRVVSFDDIRRLLHACDGKGFEERRDTALIRLMVDTGARVGEIVAMTNVSWDRRTDLVELVGKTGTRTVPLSPSTGEAVSRYQRVRNRHPKAHLSNFWLGSRGKLTAGGIAQMLYRRCDEADIPRIHPHIFRHTWAHEMKRAGAGEGDLMALGGWSTPVMVHRYGKSAAVSRAHETSRRIAIGDEL